MNSIVLMEDDIKGINLFFERGKQVPVVECVRSRGLR